MYNMHPESLTTEKARYCLMFLETSNPLEEDRFAARASPSASAEHPSPSVVSVIASSA